MKNSSRSNLTVSILGRLVTVAFIALAAPVGNAETPPLERAWQLNIAGEPSGSFTESTSTTADGKVATREVMALELNRLGSKVTMKTETESVESGNGELESLASSMSSSQATTRMQARRVDGALEVETEAGGKSYPKKIPLAGKLLGPKGVEKLSRENLKADDAVVSFQMFSPELGAIASITRKAVGRQDHAGHALLKVEETVEGMPGKQVLLLDDTGRWVTRRQSLPFGELVMQPAGETAAPAPQPKAALPTESYDKTMARSTIALPDPRTLTAVTLKLTHKQPDLGWPELKSPNQRILEKSEMSRVIEVRGFTGTATEKPEEAPDATCLQPNALIQSDDPEVVRIAREVTKGSANDLEKARRLQDWVSQNLDFDLGIALAPASEVVRNRRGTCVAYAILLASLERAAGLPSRVAMGYAYANGIWGGHAWSEAFIDGRWVALDAALYGPGPADAARLRFGASAGDDQLVKLVAAGAQMYGSVDFKLVSFEQNGRTIKVPANATAHEMKGNRYSNPWLGFSFEAPQGFRFTKMDAVFPDRTIVELEGPEAGKVAVSMTNLGADRDSAKAKIVSSLGAEKSVPRQLGKLRGEIATTPNAACFFWQQGNSLWSIKAEGKSAAQLLERIVSGWRWTS